MSNQRLQKLESRRTAPDIQTAQLLEVYRKIQEDDAVRYAIGAMQDIDPEYTKNTFAEGERVKNQLNKAINSNSIRTEFEYQGSVTNNTHIKAYSDIDLLTIHSAFVSLKPPLEPSSHYAGDVLDDLLSLREDSYQCLRSAFYEARVDNSGSKAIALSGGSLRRKIDVIASNWLLTSESEASGRKHDRSIMILDRDSRSRITNKPFHHNRAIDVRDIQFSGSVRKVIRLLKSLRYDADKPIGVSSYDIAALGYNMPDELLFIPKGFELRLVDNSLAFLARVSSDSSLRDQLLVPNGTRRIFGPDATSNEELKKLVAEIAQLKSDIDQGLQRSFRKLSEARVEY